MVRGVLAVAPEGTGVTSTGDPGLEPLHWRPDGRDWVGAPFRVVRAAPSRSTVYALERDGNYHLDCTSHPDLHCSGKQGPGASLP